jgi:type IV pilus assembly protein PilB
MRRICNGCKEEVTYPAKMFNDLQIEADFFKDAKLYRGRGCDRCKNTGYAGRVAIIEIMTVSDEIRKMVIKRASAMEIGKVAVEQGMKTLRMVALDKVKLGLSTLEQVLVVTAAH